MKTNTMLLLGGAALAAFLFMRKSAPTTIVLPGATSKPMPTSGSNSIINTGITAGASVVNNLLDNLFGKGTASVSASGLTDKVGVKGLADIGTYTSLAGGFYGGY